MEVALNADLTQMLVSILAREFALAMNFAMQAVRIQRAQEGLEENIGDTNYEQAFRDGVREAQAEVAKNCH